MLSADYFQIGSGLSNFLFSIKFRSSNFLLLCFFVGNVVCDYDYAMLLLFHIMMIMMMY